MATSAPSTPAPGRGRLPFQGRRRRPSGQAPPLPRKLETSGRFWLILVSAVAAIFALAVFFEPTALAVERIDTAMLEWASGIRTGWLTTVARATNVLGSEEVNLTMRWATILVLIATKRWRILTVFVGATLTLGWIGGTLPILVGRARPLNVDLLGDWSSYAMPSGPVAALAGTVTGMGFALIPAGRWRWRWFALSAVAVISLANARAYLAVDHPSDAVFGAILGAGIMVLAFRLLAPDEVFPVAYRRGRSAHLDVGGRRGEAIEQALEEQLGLDVLAIEPFGLAGSGGSTPLRITVAGSDRQASTDLFGKLYAVGHLRADRNYKFVRTILYGSLEDERPFSSVRHLVQQEDYLLRVMRDAGIPTAAPHGFVEITPEREYLVVTDFLEGARELGKEPVDERTVDSTLDIVRSLWDAGLAHRDVKPANILVRDGQAALIDVAFAEIRPSPWRQAVDLANAMLVLGLFADPALVYERALRRFTPDEVAEAFAATRGVTMPGQLRTMIKRSGRDLVGEFRRLAPARRQVAIQRWSLRRIAVTVGTVLGLLIALVIVLGNLQGAGLL